MRKLWQKRVVYLDSQGGIAVKSLGFRVTYVKMVQVSSIHRLFVTIITRTSGWSLNLTRSSSLNSNRAKSFWFGQRLWLSLCYKCEIIIIHSAQFALIRVDSQACDETLHRG